MEKIAVIDIETTGLVPQNDIIIEIGIVELNPETGKTKVIFDSLVKEPSFGFKHKESWIFDNSDLSYKDVVSAPLLESFRQELQDIFNTYRITAFNILFDLGFLKARNFNFPNELPCIMVTSTDICKIPQYNGRPGYKWPKAQEAWDYFFPNTDYIEKHSATDDAIHEARILFELIKLEEISL